MTLSFQFDELTPFKKSFSFVQDLSNLRFCSMVWSNVNLYRNNVAERRNLFDFKEKIEKLFKGDLV